MIVKKTSDGVIYASPGLLESIGSEPEYLEHHFKWLMDSFVSSQRKVFIDIYGRLRSLESYGILHAHGSVNGDEWVYDNGSDDGRAVQEWINEHDGNFKALILAVCKDSPHGTVSSRKSILILPNNVYSPARQSIGSVQVEMWVPGKGFINEYVIESEIEELGRQAAGLE